MHAESSRQLAHVFGRFVTALAHNVRCSECFGQRDSRRVASEKDDLFCAESLRRNDAAQTNRTVTDHGCLLAATHLRNHGGVMTSSHDIGKGQQRRNQRVIFADWQRVERAVGERDTDCFGLTAPPRPSLPKNPP